MYSTQSLRGYLSNSSATHQDSLSPKMVIFTALMLTEQCNVPHSLTKTASKVFFSRELYYLESDLSLRMGLNENHYCFPFGCFHLVWALITSHLFCSLSQGTRFLVSSLFILLPN